MVGSGPRRVLTQVLTQNWTVRCSDCWRLFGSRLSLVRSSARTTTCDHLLLHFSSAPLGSGPLRGRWTLTFLLFLFSQEVKNIGSSHNRSALPFAGFGPKVVTNQYNDPSGLYSSQNIQNFNSAVDEVKTGAAAGDANDKWVLLRPSPPGFRYRTSEERPCVQNPERSDWAQRVLIGSNASAERSIRREIRQNIHWKIRPSFGYLNFNKN